MRVVMKKKIPDAAFLMECVDYDPKTGMFRWLNRPRHHFTSDVVWKRWNTAFAGRNAFCTRSGYGYFVGAINRTPYMAHRIAYAMVVGDPGDFEIDHINGDRSDNRISNLRAVNSADNKRNSCTPKHNKSGYVGVSFRKCKQKWRASITINNRSKHLGYFDCIEQALVARKNAEKINGFHSNHGRGK